MISEIHMESQRHNRQNSLGKGKLEVLHFLILKFTIGVKEWGGMRTNWGRSTMDYGSALWVILVTRVYTAARLER